MIITIIIIIILFLAQFLYILNSQSQIRYEDLAESIRNVFWLENRLVYDGVSSNVGWYGSLLIIYKLFGFHLHAAQFFKLALYVISMVCLGLLLKKYVKHVWLPLLVLGLSPTLLYYNTIQASHGIDLLYFPIVLYLITHARLDLARLLGWAVVMWAWMSYPTFVFYLPTLVILSFLRISFDPEVLRTEGQESNKNSQVRNWIPTFVGMTVAFLAPLVIAAFFIKNRSLLLYDPQISSGVFRGGGNFDFSLDNISQNLAGLVTDLFVRGSSYHFEAYLGEFSLIFPILTIIFVLWVSFWALKYNNYKNYKYYIILALTSGLAVLVLSSLTLDPSGAPGMRRYTPILAAFYALFVIAWQQVNRVQAFGSEAQARRGTGYRVQLIKAAMILLLVHHFIVYPINLVHLKDPSPEAYPIWFNSAETPAKSLHNLVETVQKEDLKLVCQDERNVPFYCRLSEVYAAVAGSCKWNHLDCHQILGWDPQSGQLIPLTVDLWNSYYFEH